MNQMMVALFNENTKAFRNQNINGLKTGYAITIPSLTVINSISKQEANQAVREHNEQWKNRSRSVSSTEVLVANEAVNSNQQDSTQESMSDEQLASPVIGNSSNNDAEAKLSLVTPSQGDDITDETSSELGDESIKTISEQLTFAQETIEAQAQQNIEIESRMAAMEEQLETMRRLISLKDADLARLQNLLEEEQTDDESLGEQVESVVDAVVEGSQEVAEDIETVIDEINPEVEEQPETATEQVQNELSSAEEVVEAANDSGSEQEISTLINPEPTEESNDFIDTVSNLTGSDQKEVKALIQQVTEFATINKIPLSLAGILLLVILLILFRRKKTDENEEESEPEIIVAPAVEDEQDETLDDVSDENVGANTSQAPTKTAADLIDQADVFVGYADYAQARTSLEQARFIEPENTQAVSKLLFVLFKQQQTDKFIQLIMDAGVDSTHNDWQQIKEWGAELAPTNELFVDVTVNNDQLGAEIDSQQDEATDLVQDDTSETIEESVTSEQEDSYIDFNADEYQVD
jgi:pilus assembly protein FimV